MSDIQVLKNLGTDAFPNLYNVILPVVSGVPGVQGLEYRMTNFPIPQEPKPSTYTINYKTGQIQKIGSNFEGQEFELTLPVRVDKNWNVINYFKLWKEIGINSYIGLLDEALIPTGPILVQSVDTGNNTTGQAWTFEDCKPIAIEGFDFTYEEGANPISRDIILQYSIFKSDLVV